MEDGHHIGLVLTYIMYKLTCKAFQNKYHCTMLNRDAQQYGQHTE